jgi:N-acetylglucosamine-6-phosphate deacetylase
VSLGHSGAGYDLAQEALDGGARHATHLFNRMPPLGHRDPGLVGAILNHPAVAPEVICDGRHVHPGIIRMVVAAKGPDAVLAITDGTAGAGLADGARGVLGGRPITVRDGAAYLDDGTLAGSALTFDGAFRVLVNRVGLSLQDAVRLCSTTPAREMGLPDRGGVAAGMLADLVVLDRELAVVHTLIAGRIAYSRN